MPRRKKKTEKQPLRFLERPAGEARVHNVGPEVRAALNPKDFLSETQRHGSTLNSWVNPQFDTSAAASLPVKKGKRKCQSSTSIFSNLSQLSRKSSVCKFPSLSFETKTREKRHPPKHKQGKTLEDTFSLSSDQQQGCSQNKSTNRISTVQKHFMMCNGSSSKIVMNQCPAKPIIAKEISAEGSSFTASELNHPGQPDVVTPNRTQDCLLQSPRCSQLCNEVLDVLVPDTPERDYGVKVTWRRRRGLMLLLKEKGHLSDSEALIHTQ